MTLQTYYPAAPLSQFVHEFWLWENYLPAHPRERILPGGMMELIINLTGEPMTMAYPDDGFRPHYFHGPIVAGPRSTYFMVDTRRSASILAVYFKFGAAMPFFGVSAKELLNLHVPLEAIWGLHARDLYCRLLEAPTAAARFQILEQALLAQLLRYEARHRAVGYALAAFQSAPQAQTVAQVVDQIGLSPTRFIQVFSEDVGLTPKLFCRVLRFQEALRHIVQRSERTWADIALDAGYYDQSHFINDFQTFAGISPRLYVAQHPDHRMNLAVVE